MYPRHCRGDTDLGLQLRDKDEELAATQKQVADKASVRGGWSL